MIAFPGRIMASQAGIFAAVGTAFAAGDCAAESFRGGPQCHNLKLELYRGTDGPERKLLKTIDPQINECADGWHSLRLLSPMTVRNPALCFYHLSQLCKSTS